MVPPNKPLHYFFFGLTLTLEKPFICFLEEAAREPNLQSMGGEFIKNKGSLQV